MINKASTILDLPIKEINDIPVYFLNKEEYQTVYEYDGQHIANSKAMASFILSTVPDEYRCPCIIILKKLPIAYQLYVFFHEYSHYLCSKEKCYCAKNRWRYYYYDERHAWERSFQFMLYYKCYKSLAIALRVLNDYKTHLKTTGDLKMLAKDIMSQDIILKTQKQFNSNPEKYQNNLIGDHKYLKNKPMEYSWSKKEPRYISLDSDFELLELGKK